MKDDLEKYKELFLSEASEIVSSLNQNLLSLEHAPDSEEIVNEIFRGAHTLKGMAATMGFENVSRLSHEMENVLDKIRKKELIVTPDTADVLLESLDWLSILINAVRENKSESTDLSSILEKLRQIYTKEAAVDKINTDEKALSSFIQTQKSPSLSTIRVDVNLLNDLMNLVGELLIYRTKLEQIAKTINEENLSITLHQTNKLMNIIQEKVLKTRIVPIEQIFNRFPRLIRDLAKSTKKELELVIEGSDIGIDRMILDDVAECLAHLINNAAAHGIEMPEDRLARGKAKQGKINLKAKREKGFITIELSDNGAGMDPVKIREHALNTGIITSDEVKTLSDEEALMLITHPGFSTAKEVTKSSGRGVGMDAVKNKVEQLGGTLSIESKPGIGSKFILRLPVTLAIIQTLLVRIGEQMFHIPFLSTRELISVSRDNIISINEKKYVKVKSDQISLINLAEMLDIKPDNNSNGKTNIVIAEIKNQKKGLMVDKIIKHQEIVVKPLPDMFRDIKYFSGATITAEGKVVLVLDINVLA